MRFAGFFAMMIAATVILCVCGDVRADIEVSAIKGEMTYKELTKVDVENKAMVFDNDTIKMTGLLNVRFSPSKPTPNSGYRIFFRNKDRILGEVVGGRVVGADLLIKVKSPFTNNKVVEYSVRAVAGIQNLELGVYRELVFNALIAQAATAAFGKVEFLGEKMDADRLRQIYDNEATIAKFNEPAKELLDEITNEYNGYISDKRRQGYDFFFGVKDDEIELNGTVDDISDKDAEVEFSYGGRTIKGKLKDIVGLMFKLGSRPSGFRKRPYVSVTGVYGSNVTGEIVASTATTITVKTDLSATAGTGGGTPVQFDIPLSAIAGIEFYNGDFEFLSDFPDTLIAKNEYEIISSASPTAKTPNMFFMRRNRSTQTGSGSGSPAIKINGKEYKKGVGCHSYSKLSFNLSGSYVQFCSLLAINDGTNGRGDVDVSIECDGKVVYTKKGLKPGMVEKIQIDVRGVTTLTLIVDFGKDWHHFDHVVWANAILVK